MIPNNSGRANQAEIGHAARVPIRAARTSDRGTPQHSERALAVPRRRRPPAAQLQEGQLLPAQVAKLCAAIEPAPLGPPAA